MKIELIKYIREPVFCKVVFLLMCILFLFAPVIESMWNEWMSNSNNSHGILVPFLSLYLFHKRFEDPVSREKMKGESDLSLWSPEILLGLFGILFALVLYFLGVVGGILIFKRLAFVLSILSTVIFVFGWRTFDTLRFPLLFLFFMIPVPVTVYGIVALPLQLLTTKVSVFVLQFSPLPIWAEGNIIHVGREMLEVAEACSGLRSLISFIMIASLFAYLARVKMWQKLSIVAASIPVAVVGNVVRIIFTSFIAYIYGSKVASGFIHDVSGYIMFILAFIIFMGISSKLEGIKSNVDENPSQ